MASIVTKPLQMSTIIKRVSKLKTEQEKIDFLQLHHSPQFHWLLNFALHPGIIFELPTTSPPYNPSDMAGEAAGVLYKNIGKLKYFCKGIESGLIQSQKEMMFIGLLEEVEKDDALLLLSVKNKVLPKGITEALINSAYGSYDPLNPNVICPCKNGGFKL